MPESHREPPPNLAAEATRSGAALRAKLAQQLEAPDGRPLAMAIEDSIVLSLLRRVLGTLFGVLRTNFLLVRGEDAEVFGEFNRKFTLLDRYVLDLSADPARIFDRRIALALGVMLDTGERR